METLTKNEMEKILGGGYWITTEDGQVIYIPVGDEEEDDNDVIFA